MKTKALSARIRRLARLLLAAPILWLVGAANPGCANALESDWQVRPEFYLSGNSNFRRQESESTSFDTLGATAYLTIHSPARSYFGGLVVDYRYSSSDRFDDNINLGGYIRANLDKWDTTTWVLVNRSPHNPDTWLYLTRLRYRVGERSKLGMEAMAPLDNAGEPRLMLGYYGDLAKSLSLDVMAGTGTAGTPDFSARIELSWRLR